GFELLRRETLFRVVAAQAIEDERVQLRRDASATFLQGHAATCRGLARSRLGRKNRIGNFRQRVFQQHGEIEIESALDQGTRQAQCRTSQRERILVAGGFHADRENDGQRIQFVRQRYA